MKFYVILPLFLCLLSMAMAQVAMPAEQLWGRPGRDRDNDADATCSRRRGCRGNGNGNGNGNGRGGRNGKGQQVKGGADELKVRIGDLKTKVNNAKQAVEPFKGGNLRGLVGLLKVNEAVVELGNTIDMGTKSAEATDVLPAAASTQIGTQFLDLQPDISGLLSELQGKRREFDKAGFRILDVRSLIRDSVVIQQDKASDLGGAFTKILDKSLQPIAEQVNTQIQANFSEAVDMYKGRAGKIKIPSAAVPALSDLLSGVARALGIGDRNRAVMAADGTEAVPITNFTTVSAAAANIEAADTVMANNAAEAFMARISDEELSRLGPDENDTRGIPPLVMAVLRRYGVI
ncbi:hypothetical protein C8035_v004808 [Colletotrichum spinosum]|uniref:Antigenic cell wall n=1 Tax=Colletotrichum spinosum TaxID=1347390 RepID=A0A4R8QKD0_9PEZI|nr:hypothetical protein C8035_v004808 [Colletotrichum spinosum]